MNFKIRFKSRTGYLSANSLAPELLSLTLTLPITLNLT